MAHITVLEKRGEGTLLRVFLSRNYHLIVVPREFDVPEPIFLLGKRYLEGKSACFKDMKFPRSNYQPIVPRQTYC